MFRLRQNQTALLATKSVTATVTEFNGFADAFASDSSDAPHDSGVISINQP